MKKAMPAIIGFVVAIAVLLWVSHEKNAAYKSGYKAAKAEWSQALADAELKNREQEKHSWQQTQQAEQEISALQQRLNKELKRINEQSTKNMAEGGSSCGLDAFHVGLLNGQARN